MNAGEPSERPVSGSKCNNVTKNMCNPLSGSGKGGKWVSRDSAEATEVEETLLTWKGESAGQRMATGDSKRVRKNEHVTIKVHEPVSMKVGLMKDGVSSHPSMKCGGFVKFV